MSYGVRRLRIYTSLFFLGLTVKDKAFIHKVALDTVAKIDIQIKLLNNTEVTKFSKARRHR